MTVDEIIAEVVAREGGYVDHPADRGGPTKFGITQATLAEWRGHAVTADDVERLLVSEARNIYRRQYVELPGFEALPDPVRAYVVDAGVLSGPAQATRWLQAVLGVAVDGVCGPVTRAAAEAANGERLVLRMARERCLGLAAIVSRNPSQSVFLVGWISRALDPLR